MTDSAIICDGGECPTCGGESTAIIGPCDYCTEYFHEHGQFPKRKKPQEAKP